MSPNFDDYRVSKKESAPKVKKGTYRNYTREDLKKAGFAPIDEKGRLLRCIGEQNFCFYDKHLLSVEIDGQVAVLKKCNQCGTIYYSSASGKEEKPVVLTEAIGSEIEAPKPSGLEIKAEEPRI